MVVRCRYVLCNSCKSPDTLLDRDSATRIMFLRCQQVCTLPANHSLFSLPDNGEGPFVWPHT
jgi:hypothetical protein